MRIDRLDMLSYGHLRAQSLDLSRPTAGLTLVLGPNEAGKSTTLRAIKALLFGIERGAADDYGMGRESLRVGAALRDGDGAVIEVIRQALAKAPLVTPEGEAVEQEGLDALFGGVERALFAALFCIDHDELHERSFELLDPDAEIGRLVFGASLGAAPLMSVQKELEGRADALFKPRGSSQLVARTLTQARQLAKQARDIRVRTRDWEEAERELERLGNEATALGEQLAGLRAQESYLARVISALPLLARLSGLRDDMDQIERDGPVQTDDWAAAVGHAQDRLDEAEADYGRAVKGREGLQLRLQGMPPSSPLLVAAERVDALLEGIGRFRKDRLDLPGLQGELAASSGSLAGLLERLGVDESTARGVTDAQLATVEELTQSRTAIDERLSSATQELDTLVASIERSERDLRELPEAPNVESLAGVAAVARTFLERERQAGEERAAHAGLAGDIEAGAQRLGLDATEFDALERLPVPTLASVREHRERRAELASRRMSCEQRFTSCREDERTLNDRRDQILADATVPDPGAVAAARERREEGWRLVRAAWLADDLDQAAVKQWAGEEALEDAFEASIHDADAQADARFEHAAKLATLEQIAISIAELLEKQGTCDADEQELDGAAARLDDEWRILWEPAGVLPARVDEGEELLSGVGEIQRAVADHRRRAVALEEVEKELTAQRMAVVAALADIGVKADCASLALVIEQADTAVQKARAAEEARTAARRAVEQGSAERPHREEAVRRATEASDAWQLQWAEALASTGMTASTGLAAGRQTLRLLREYRGELAKAESLRSRVDGVQQDIATYAASVSELLNEVAPDLAGLDTDRALSELKPRLDEARKESRLRDDLVSQEQAAEDLVATADQELHEARAALARLREQAGLGAEADLTREAQRATQHAAWDEAARDVEDTLVAQSGGLRLKELLAAVDDEGAGEGELKARLDGVKTDIEQTDERLTVVNREYGTAKATFAALDHGGKAAEYEQDAELEFAALAGHVSEYARVALAGEILRRVVADYGQRNQGPIMGLAGRNFRTLTDGAFDDLLTDLDGDKQLLLARRRNGEILHLDELSEGTVDQLYLALRLAGVEHHLERSAANPPVILDDLLVNFDDARAASALRLFADLGRRAQVLLFTHHRHLCVLASETLPADQLHVAELGARDHAAPVVVPERPVARGRGRPNVSAGDGEASEAAIFEVLADAPAPLGKSEILALAGIPDTAWTAAIRSLVDRGAVVQEGVKRGAKYHLGGADG